MDNSQHGNKTEGLADPQPEEKEQEVNQQEVAAAKDGAEDVKVSREEYVDGLMAFDFSQKEAEEWWDNHQAAEAAEAAKVDNKKRQEAMDKAVNTGKFTLKVYKVPKSEDEGNKMVQNLVDWPSDDSIGSLPAGYDDGG